MAQRGETVKFHKKKSEFQMSIVKPEYDQKGYVNKKGMIFFEIANALEGQDKMDWGNKVVMKIGVTDIGKIMANLKTGKDVKIYHENATGNSALNITKGEHPGTYGLSFSQKKGEEVSRSAIYFNGEDMNVFMTLLTAGLPAMLGW